MEKSQKYFEFVFFYSLFGMKEYERFLFRAADMILHGATIYFMEMLLLPAKKYFTERYDKIINRICTATIDARIGKPHRREYWDW